LGLAHEAQSPITVAPRSSRHSKVAPASALNDQDGEVLEPAAGGADVMVVPGPDRSRVKLCVLSGPTLPAMSVE